jgi:hypothetical protein
MYKSFILHCSDLELKAATLHFTESIKSILRISEVLGSSENKILYCSFQVKAKVSFPQIVAGTIVWIEKVQVIPELKGVCIINGYGYFE